jgi:hypothetical protein
MSHNGQAALYQAINALIDYHVQEFKLSAIEIIGALEYVKLEVQQQAAEVAHLTDLEDEGEGDDESFAEQPE